MLRMSTSRGASRFANDCLNIVPVLVHSLNQDAGPLSIVFAVTIVRLSPLLLSELVFVGV